MERFKIAKQRILDLKGLMYCKSAYYLSGLENHEQAAADARYCKKIGGVINLGDFFADPADGPSEYQPHSFKFETKFV